MALLAPATGQAKRLGQRAAAAAEAADVVEADVQISDFRVLHGSPFHDAILSFCPAVVRRLLRVTHAVKPNYMCSGLACGKPLTLTLGPLKPSTGQEGNCGLLVFMLRSKRPLNDVQMPNC